MKSNPVSLVTVCQVVMVSEEREGVRPPLLWPWSYHPPPDTGATPAACLILASTAA